MYRLVLMGIYSFLCAFAKDTVVVNETFNDPDGALPAFFWSEGNAASVKNGRLFIDADTTGSRAATIWLDRELAGDLSVEFDVYLLSSSDDANNVNIFFMYGDPSGRPLRQTAASRQDGLYRRYHTLSGYIFTNVTNEDPGRVRYRFRRNPGFKRVSESFGPRAGRGGKLHIKLVKKGDQFEYWENNRKTLEASDTGPCEKGLFGFRTWHTSMEIDNLLIKRIG
ncbi:DUF6250 domain-containing protein [Niabella drilacis]|uniref:DUF6250 domain-containing protein n=1 Tax=Niabella drilacis (strain DSM 25811 / CCM 8410 / CCUG 62505 / LMG 26954 / E90) TaxID=1285928 RepID=A0A1G6RID2_NIADE|nr:DUF6250 domain-containing protein [Niabella drilacis]SDD03676.1 hypothetical protein SAMN04487894_105274 [Niabella drilacis]